MENELQVTLFDKDNGYQKVISINRMVIHFNQIEVFIKIDKDGNMLIYSELIDKAGNYFFLGENTLPVSIDQQIS